MKDSIPPLQEADEQIFSEYQAQYLLGTVPFLEMGDQ